MRYQAGTGKALPTVEPEHHNAWTSFRLARLKHQIRWTFLPTTGPKDQIRSTSLPMTRPKHQIHRTSLPMTVRQTYMRSVGPPCLWPDRPPWNLPSYWREEMQPQKTWIQKRIWKLRSSRFFSPTGIVCQGLVQTG